MLPSPPHGLRITRITECGSGLRISLSPVAICNWPGSVYFAGRKVESDYDFLVGHAELVRSGGGAF